MDTHGGGGDFISNNVATANSVSYSSNLNSGLWYKLIFSMTQTGASTFDLDYQIWNSGSDGTLGTLITEQTRTGVTNSNLGSAGTIYAYFSATGDRMRYVDNFTSSGSVATGNYALSFDGVNDYVSLPNTLWNNNFSNGTAISVEFWFKGSGINSVYRVQNSEYFVAGYYGGNHIISTDGLTNGVSIGNISTIQNGSWHHLAMTWSKNGYFTSYLDGSQVAQRAAANVYLPAINIINCLGSLGGSTEFLTGSLDEVRIWNVVRTAQQIADNRNSELTGNESGLVAYYKMSNGSGTNLSDNAAGSYSGTMVNGVSWTTGPNLTGSCNNPTSGGIISATQTICSGYTPAAFTSTSIPSGHTGSLEYKWQVSTTSGTTGFADYTSGTYTSTTLSFGTATLTQTSWFKRLSKVSCDASWPAAGESNVLEVTVNPPSYSGSHTIADLQAGTGSSTISWYAIASGGTALATSTTLVNGHHYYASQIVNGVESNVRLDVTASVDLTPCAPAGDATQSGNSVADLIATGGTAAIIRWYDAATNGSVLPASTLLQIGSHYYATQTIGCTESAKRLDVTAVTP